MDLVGEATEVLNDFGRLRIRDELPRTFMEIAGYPRRENVCSNILAFFLDPEEEHGLGTLMLDALVVAGVIAPAGPKASRNVRIEREVRTATGKRIDILVQSDEYVIAIENKIDAPLDNPLDEYVTYLKINFPRLKRRFLLLTVRPTDAGGEWRNLRYDQLVKQVRLKLGQHISGADTRHLTLFLDFLNILENFIRGTRMDPKLIEFLATRHDEVERLLNLVSEVKGEMKGKTAELRNLIEIEGYEGVTRDFDRPAAYLYDDLRHDIPVTEELTIRVETSLFPMGWQIWIWPVNGSYHDMIELLQELEIPYEEYEVDGGVQHSDSYVHKYDDDLDGIRELLQGLIDRLATSSVDHR